MNVVEYDAASKVDEHRAAVVVDGQQETCIGRERNDCNVLPVLKRECPGFVATEENTSMKRREERRSQTNLTRSKTATRFPTGLSRLLPSGVKRTLPCLYTVPHMFENCWNKSTRHSLVGRLTHLKVGLHLGRCLGS